MPLFDSSFENKSGSFHFLVFCLFLISNSICLDCADAQPTVRISCPRVCTLDVKFGVADILSDIQLACLQMLSSKPVSNHTLLTPPPPPAESHHPQPPPPPPPSLSSTSPYLTVQSSDKGWGLGGWGGGGGWVVERREGWHVHLPLQQQRRFNILHLHRRLHLRRHMSSPDSQQIWIVADKDQKK